LEPVEGVEEGVAPVVEGVVVGEGHTAHTEVTQRLDGDRWRPEEERLARVGPWLAPVRDGAFEVEDEEVGLAGDSDDLGGEQSIGRDHGEAFADLAAQHRVARQRELHGASATSHVTSPGAGWVRGGR
jgi:hypothetical protein